MPAQAQGNRSAGQKAPGDLRVYLSKASARKLHQSNGTEPKSEALQRMEKRRPLEGLLPITSEPAPSHRPWISARARPLADRFKCTTGEKRPARLVTFLRDPTTPISVTWLNDLTGGLPCGGRRRDGNRLENVSLKTVRCGPVVSTEAV